MPDVSLDVVTYKSHSHYQRQKSNRAYFDAVIAAYGNCRTMSPVPAACYDHDARAHKFGPSTIEYCVDVEHASEAALKAPTLLSAWSQIVTGDHVPAEIQKKVTALCAPIYRARQLGPWDYFKRIKRGRTDRKAAAV